MTYSGEGILGVICASAHHADHFDRLRDVSTPKAGRLIHPAVTGQLDPASAAKQQQNYTVSSTRIDSRVSSGLKIVKMDGSRGGIDLPAAVEAAVAAVVKAEELNAVKGAVAALSSGQEVSRGGESLPAVSDPKEVKGVAGGVRPRVSRIPHFGKA